MFVNDAYERVRSLVPGRVVRRGRRIWAAHGRALIEVRGSHHAGTGHFADELERALRALNGVRWAALNAAAGRVVVAFDDGVGIDDLVAVIAKAEEAFGFGADDVAPMPHPADDDPFQLRVLEIGADAAGIALGFGLGALRLPRLPAEVAAALPAIDMLPPVRRVLDARRGVEAAFVSTSAVLQGLAQGPLGLVVDATHRTLLLREAGARRRAWERTEPELHADPGTVTAEPIERADRPVSTPDGAIENYARRVAKGSLAAGGGVLALTRSPRRSADLVLAAVPRAARLGREAFGAQLSCVLASRDVVVMDPRVLRHLDRIDTVVVDGDLFDASPAALDAVVGAVRDAAQDLVVALAPGSPSPEFEHDLTIEGGDELRASVQRLQCEGRIVALISAHGRDALAAADCGIGVRTDMPPWGADLLCPTLFDAAVVIDATAAARTANKRIVAITGAGSGLAAMLSFGPQGSGRRTMITANASSLTAIGAGVWSAASLAHHPPVAAGDAPDAVSWHSFTGEDALAQLGSSARGLTSSEAAHRRSEDDVVRRDGLLSLMAAELANPLTAVLGAGGVLSTLTGSITDGVLITSVLGVNALVGATQRMQTDRAINRLTSAMSARTARVRRGGHVATIARDEVVEGDVLVLQAGDVITADARLLSASPIETDESALTGESMPVAKTADVVAPDTPVAERSCMLYAGTAVASGRGEAVVVATGARTEARRGAANGARAPMTGVETRLDDLSRRTVPLVIAAGGVLTASSLLRRTPMREAVATGVSLAAAAVPEGLPFLATIAQSAAARRLSEHGVLVRNPRVLEALGRADVLCFDKTGTLTEGHLQLRSISDGHTVDTMPLIGAPRLDVLAAAVRATPRRRDEDLPHPTDQAIVDGAAALEVDAQLGVEQWNKTVALPFEPSRGYHAVLGRTAARPVLSVKGAPEVILPRCDRWRRGNEYVPLDDAARRRLERHMERLASQGLRVLAVAEREASHRNDLDDNRVDRLDFVGCVTVADAARSSAVAPIARLLGAGISVVMLTGDHPQTAAAIGEELGLVNGGVVTGTDIDGMSDDQLDDVMRHATVFARVTPAHKVRIVQAFQRLGRVVAMTGDGANDAQAIRLADIGIAFGPRATSAARAAADLVIVDDRVETLITSIVEGRAMWASVRDALALLLGGNLGEVLFTTGAGIVDGRSPLNARQLLAVNLLTDLAPALAISLQRPRSATVDLRRVGPEASLGGQLTREIAVRAVATAGAAAGAWTFARVTGTRTHASTVALAALVGAQLGQTIVVGSRSPVVLASGVLSAAALFTVVQVPGVSGFFGCRPLGPIGWTVAGTAAGIATIGAYVAGRWLVPGRDEQGAHERPMIDLRDAEADNVSDLGTAIAN